MTNEFIYGMGRQNDFALGGFGDVEAALYTIRGRFYPDKNYGSQIRLAANMPREFYALCYARQALYNMNGVFVKSVHVSDDKYDFTILINDEERQVQIPA